MTKEYLSKFIGYRYGHYYEWSMIDYIVLIRPWYLPNTKLEFERDVYTQSHGYREALSKVKEYFDGK